MSRKDYRLIAAELLRQRPDIRGVNGVPTYASAPAWERGAYDEWATIVIGLAGVLSAEGGYDLNGNRRFKRDLFLKACGLDARDGSRA
jgi:hypothetical protein